MIDRPNPLRTYQRIEHEVAKRRKFFSFKALTRCKSLPSIYNPTLHAQKKQSTEAFKEESTTMHHPTPSIKEPLFTKRANLSLQELAKRLRDISDARKTAPSLKAPSPCPNDKAVRITKCRSGLRWTKSDLPWTSKQRWKITIHKRLPTVIWPFSQDREIKFVTLPENCYAFPCKSAERIWITLR